MHLVFERSAGRFKSNCNILSLAWSPYYDESKFRASLFDYHQRQLIQLTSSIAAGGGILGQNQVSNGLQSVVSNPRQAADVDREVKGLLRNIELLNARLRELNKRHGYLMRSAPIEGTTGQPDLASRAKLAADELDELFGRRKHFGWLVVGNVGKTVGVTLTSTVPSPLIKAVQPNDSEDTDLIRFETEDSHGELRDSNQWPENGNLRTNYNLRGHLDEIILVKWNELFQKLATIDSKGNVLIWCKTNGKFTVQTPFYNKTKSVADFKWSNDGKTALICYTDSFILVGSSTGQRHWHSMLNLEDYHITCASWTPNDDQLLLGVSNGNVVVIDLPRSELTELAINHTNIRAMAWSSSDLNLSHLSDNRRSISDDDRARVQAPEMGMRRGSVVVNHRRLSRDCSVFSRYSTSNSTIPGTSDERQSVNLNQPENAHLTMNSTILTQQTGGQLRNILAIDFANNTIKLYDGLDDPKPKTIVVNQESYVMSWSGDGRCLAVAGFNINTTAPSVGCLRCRYLNAIKFYNQSGELIYEYVMRYTRYPITAFTWAHDDQRIFVATGSRLHCAKVMATGAVAPLSLLAMSCIQRFTRLPTKSDLLDQLLKCRGTQGTMDKSLASNLATDRNIKSLWQSRTCPISLDSPIGRVERKLMGVEKQLEEEDRLSACRKVEDHQILECNNVNAFRYHLPLKLQSKLDSLFCPTIKQPFDDLWSLSDIVWHVPKAEQRYYCTLVCYTSEQELSMSSYHGTNQLGNHQLERGLMAFDKRQKKVTSGPNSDRTRSTVSSDMNKIFVMYVEFQGSLIPILRARRVGYLKPEFVIFDPDCNDLRRAQRQRKVSDISGTHQASAQYRSTLMQTDSHSNETFSSKNNSLDWQLYNEPRASGSSMSRQSVMSDADQYYNFDLDSGSPAIARRLAAGSSKMVAADLTSDRSYYQEPVALPTNNMHLMYMMSSIGAGHQQIQGRGPMMLQAPIRSLHQATSSCSRQRSSRRVRQSNRENLLNENSELLRIKSNVWGTKFKLINVANRTIKQRSIIGSLDYKASILHLQPRIILLSVRDMSNYCCLCSKHHHMKANQIDTANAQSIRDSDQQANIVDAPNIISLPATPLRASRTRRRATKTTKDDDKVFVPVGDGLRIAPRLLANRHYQTKNRTDRTPSGNLSSVMGQRLNPEADHQNPGFRSSRLEARAGASVSESHRPINPSFVTPRRSLSKGGASKEGGFNSVGNTEDDILTLSLWQGDRVKVEMSSLRQEASDKDRANNEKMEKFLASNKSLKSIQSITKMIVDLSSRANEDSSPKLKNFSSKEPADPVTDPELQFGPSTSRSFVAPDTHVHRPRRPHRMASVDRSAELSLSSPHRVTRSAASSPIKSQQSRRRRRMPQPNEPPIELPPPPAMMPIVRRLSSSAKRFIDGSLRSLYSGIGGGYSTSTEVDPDESEPLVPFNLDIRSRPTHCSQPSSPLKCRTKTGRDLGQFRDHLLARLHGHKGNSRKADGEGQLRIDNEISSSSPSSYHSDSDLDFSSDSDLDSDLETTRYSRQPLKSRQSMSVKDLRELGRFSCSISSKLTRKRDGNLGKLVGQSQQENNGKEQIHKVAQNGNLKSATKNKRTIKCPYKNCCCSRELKLTNRPPVWNEQSQVYQLDFGGRVTQESAKNLQIDHRGKLVSLFGVVVDEGLGIGQMMVSYLYIMSLYGMHLLIENVIRVIKHLLAKCNFLN